MNKRTLIIIVGIIAAMLALGCSKKSDPAPVHQQSDYVGTYTLLGGNVHQLKFIVFSNYSIDNGVIDGVASDVTIQMGSNEITRVELSNQPLNLDFVITGIHYSGSTVQGTVLFNGSSNVVTLNKY